MARFDIHAFNNPDVPYVLDVQADLLSSLNTRVVIPLMPEKSVPHESLPRLKPVIYIKDANYILMTTDIAAIASHKLGPRVSNAEEQYRQIITDSLDFLFQGF